MNLKAYNENNGQIFERRLIFMSDIVLMHQMERFNQAIWYRDDFHQDIIGSSLLQTRSGIVQQDVKRVGRHYSRWGEGERQAPASYRLFQPLGVRKRCNPKSMWKSTLQMVHFRNLRDEWPRM